MKRRHPRTRLPRHLPVGQMRRNLVAVQRFRLNFLFGAILVLFLGLLGRIGKLQVVDAHGYRDDATRRHHRHVTFKGLRGRIVDRHGRTLVASRRVLSVAVDPQVVRDPRFDIDPTIFARRVAVLLDQERDAARIFRSVVDAPEGCRHRVIQAQVEDERLVPHLRMLKGWEVSKAAGLAGLKVEEHEQRTYPNGDYAAHVLGRAPRVERGHPTGGYGLESAFHQDLKGSRLKVPVLRDGGKDRRIRAALAVDPSRATGRDLRLTLDIVIQHYLEKALETLRRDWDAPWATGIVLDPATGEVLALASHPTFDPTRDASRMNYAIQANVEPGSIWKPFTVAQALSLGVVGLDDRIPMPAAREFAWRRGRRVVHDHHPMGEWDGCGSLLRLLTKSSNTASAELLWRVMEVADGAGGPSDRSLDPVLWWLNGLGFAEDTGIELRGEPPVQLFRREGARNPLHPTLGFAFGQGFAASPLRLLCCFAAFARDDARVVKPTLLPGRGGPRMDLPPVCARPEHLHLIREGLADCVDEGTARSAFQGCPYEVAGKTGTPERKGAVVMNFPAFAGYAPRERPRLAVLVMAKVAAETSHRESELRPYGGNVAGPAVRAVLEQSLAYLDGQALEGGTVEGPER